MIELRASNFGSCIRRQVATATGMSELPPPPPVQGWYDRGNQHEIDCVRAMMDAGWEFIDAYPRDDTGQQRVEVSFFEMNVMISGHLDGVAKHPMYPFKWIVEMKAPATFARFKKAWLAGDYSDPYMAQIAWQISVYMHATGLPVLMASWNEEDGLQTWEVETAPYTWQETRERAGTIAKLIENGDVPVTCSQDDGWTCPVRYLHEAKEPNQEILSVDARQVIAMYGQYGEVKKKAEGLLKEMRPRLDQVLEGLGAATYDAGEYAVTIAEVKGGARWDERQLVNLYGPDVLKCKVEGEPGRRVTVKKKEGEGEEEG